MSSEPTEPKEDGHYAAGAAVMKRLFGRMPDRGYIPQEFFDLTVSRVYGELWNRPHLEQAERSLLTVAVLAAQGKAFELELHLRGARNLGLPREKMEEVMVHLAHYCGWPTALQGFKSVDRVYGAAKAGDHEA